LTVSNRLQMTPDLGQRPPSHPDRGGPSGPGEGRSPPLPSPVDPLRQPMIDRTVDRSCAAAPSVAPCLRRTGPCPQCRAAPTAQLCSL